MKRTTLKRKTALERPACPLSRRRGLVRGTGLKRGERAQRPILGLETCREVYRRQRGLCACGCGGRIAPFPIGYHHVLPKAKWPKLADVAANVVGLTADCHANHETASRRLPWEAIEPVLALDLDPRQHRYLQTHYPGS